MLAISENQLMSRGNLAVPQGNGNAPSTGVSSSSLDNGNGNPDICNLCSAKLGKRHLNPRHRCRVCDYHVCGKCSPNDIQLPEQDGTHRACNRCVLIALRAFHVRNALAGLAETLVGNAGVTDDLVLSREFKDACQDIQAVRNKAHEAEATAKSEQRKQAEFQAICQAAVSACGKLNKVLTPLGGDAAVLNEPPATNPAAARFCRTIADRTEAELVHDREKKAQLDAKSKEAAKKLLTASKRLRNLAGVQETAAGSSLQEACDTCVRALDAVEEKVTGPGSQDLSALKPPRRTLSCFSCLTG